MYFVLFKEHCKGTYGKREVHSHRFIFLGFYFFSNSTERLGLNTEVGGNHVLRDALFELRVAFLKSSVLLFCGKAKSICNSVLGGDVSTFYNFSKETF